MRSKLLILLVVLSTVAAVLSARQTSQDLFQKALAKERSEGDPAGAIRLYERVVKESGQDRKLAAEALFRIGECHQALGDAEARRAFERLLREFSDQAEVASRARDRLAALAVPENKPTFTRIRIPTKLPDSSSLVLSPDGNRLAYMSDGSVWILSVRGASDPTIAGAPTRLTEPIPTWSWCDDIVWSRDGNWLALHITDRSRDGTLSQSCYLVRVATGDIRRVSLEPRLRALLYLDAFLGLSPDGRSLAYTTWPQAETFERKSIYLVPTSGGIAKQLTKPPTVSPTFSPDGTRIVYLATVSDPAWAATYPRAREVWVVPVSGGTPVLVYAHPGPGLLFGPTWSSDGKAIAFLLNHDQHTDGCDEMMIIPLGDNGRASGPSSLVKLPTWTGAKPLGWGADNRIGLSLNAPELTAIYTVPSSGGKAAQLTPKYSTMPRWTPDQKKIFFFGANQGEFADLECIPAEGGKVTRVPLRGPHWTILGWGLSISPDGRSILFQGRFLETPEGQRRHMFTVPIEGGQVTEIALGVDDFSCPAWAPDGKSFAFVGAHDVAEGKTVNDIYTIPAGGGKAQKLTSEAHRVAGAPIAWSPDGSVIAFYADDESENAKVELLPVAGGPARILVEGLKGSHGEADLAWSPDGKQLAYINNDRIWKVSLEIRRSEELKTGLDAIHQGLAWSPDGRTIAFSAKQGGEQELWLMENFLPPAKAKR